MAKKQQSDKNPNEIIITGARLSFPQLWKPKAIRGGKARYTVNLLLDPKNDKQKPQIVRVKKMIERLTTEEFKTDKKLPRDRTCLRKDEEPRWEGYDGMWYVTAARAEEQDRPLIIDRGRNKLDPGSTIPYAGCFVNCKIRLYAQDFEGVKRINASLEVVQFVKDGEPFGAGQATADDMPEYEEEEMDGLDDEGIGDDDDLD